MSETFNLTATVREGKVATINDTIPAVIYGSGIENMNLSVNRNQFEAVFAKSGESGLIKLSIDGREEPVIVKDLQMDPVKHRIIHVDFFKLNMKEKVTAEVSLHFIGEAPAVKAHGGIVVHNADAVEIECLPADLIQGIDVDLSTLENIGDSITIADLKVPANVAILGEAEAMIVHVVEPKKHEEEAPVAVEGEAAPAEAKAEEKKDEDKK